MYSASPLLIGKTSAAAQKAGDGLAHWLPWARIAALPWRHSVSVLAVVLVALAGTGCQIPQGQAQEQRGGGEQRGGDRPIAVETAIAQTDALEATIAYTGSTQPLQLVSLRAQTDGRLLNLSVDVGDRVQQGQVVGQIDDRLLTSSLSQAQAELAARESEISQAEAEVSDVQTQVDQARFELQQAIADAARLQSLAAEGAVTEQQAEQAQTARNTAEQAVRSAQERVRTRQRAVEAARGRAAAQQATLAEVGQRRAYSQLQASASGTVIQRFKQPGDLAQPGEEVYQIGDFSGIKVIVQVSELELGSIRPGQAATVRLDAFPDRTFEGVIERISPAADSTARLIPVEVVIPNPEGRISSGLLARVEFAAMGQPQIVVPDEALEVGESEASEVLFVVEGEGEDARAIARPVTVGDRADNRVEIRSGINPGDRIVVRSGQPLEDGKPVRLSILSQSSEEPASSP